MIDIDFTPEAIRNLAGAVLRQAVSDLRDNHPRLDNPKTAQDQADRKGKHNAYYFFRDGDFKPWAKLLGMSAQVISEGMAPHLAAIDAQELMSKADVNSWNRSRKA